MDGWIYTLCIGISLVVIAVHRHSKVKLYLTQNSLQIVRLTGRQCIGLREIKELLYRNLPKGGIVYFIKTTQRIYPIGKLQSYGENRLVLKKLAKLIKKDWENTTKYFGSQAEN